MSTKAGKIERIRGQAPTRDKLRMTPFCNLYPVGSCLFGVHVSRVRSIQAVEKLFSSTDNVIPGDWGQGLKMDAYLLLKRE